MDIIIIIITVTRDKHLMSELLLNKVSDLPQGVLPVIELGLL